MFLNFKSGIIESFFPVPDYPYQYAESENILAAYLALTIFLVGSLYGISMIVRKTAYRNFYNILGLSLIIYSILWGLIYYIKSSFAVSVIS